MRRSCLLLWVGLVSAIWSPFAFCQEDQVLEPAAGSSQASGAVPFLLGGIQTHELDHQRWMASLLQTGMNTVQVTVYAHQGPWNSAKLWYSEQEPAVLREIRAARDNGVQVVLVLRVALDHNYPENRFMWHGLIYPETEKQTREWFQIYTDFVVKWAKIAQREGVEVLGIASEMNSLAATLPVKEAPHLAAYYLDDGAQERLRMLVQRSKDLFTEDALLTMGAGDFDSLDELLSRRNAAERVWARSYTFQGAEDSVSRINLRRRLLEDQWRHLIRRVRKEFSGRLTLAANFDNYHEVSFWDDLDYLGINAYFALRQSLQDPLDQGRLESAWREVFDTIGDFRKQHDLGQKVIFTELGYTRYQGVTVAPWSSKGFIPLWDPEGDEENDRAFIWSSQPIDPEERALAMKALHQVWSEGETGLAGILYWKLSSRLDLQRFEPFMLYLGADAEDPLLPALKRFADHIRPLTPRTTGDDPYLSAVDAIVRDDLATLKSLGIEVSQAPGEGRSPLLHLAVRLGRRSAARHLLALGAPLDGRDGAGFLPIHWACFQDDPSWVAELLPRRDVPLNDDRQETPLMKCARLDNVAVAEELLRRQRGEMQARNQQGRNALHLAVDQASVQMVETLLAAGGAVDVADNQGENPVHLAARRGQVEVVQAVAKVSKGRADPDGNLPVHRAAYYANLGAFRALFEPERSTETNHHGHNLLHFAAFGGQPEILNTLFEHYPRVDMEDVDGWTPLFFSILNAHAEAAALLVEQGAAILHRDKNRVTALHYAAGCREPQVIRRFLIEKNVKVNVRDGKGQTPLHYAAGWGRLDNLRLLLAAGADPGLKNREGETPLDVALGNGRQRAADLLYEAELRLDEGAPGPLDEEPEPTAGSG